MILRVRLHSNRLQKLCLVLFSGWSALLVSCSVQVREAKEQEALPRMYPDYADVTIPYNIAPLNFKVQGEPEAVVAEVRAGNGTSIRVSGKDVRIPLKKWKRLLEANKGKDLEVKVYARWDDGWKGYPVFRWTVSERAIDPYLTYRLIEPGYFTVNRMGLYYRNIENFEEKAMIDNHPAEMGCVNCHAFCQGDPNRMLFHARDKNPGTYLYADGELVKLNTKAGPMKWPAVYPFWHPGGNYVAFSINPLRLNFYSGKDAVKELYDLQADVMVYDVRTRTVLTTPQLYDEKVHNNYPVFSPDGKRLFYCTDSLPEGDPKITTPELKLSLCAVDFDAETGKLGTRIDTLVSSDKTGKSIIHPRISPDGKYVVYTQLDYGSFYYYKAAELGIYNMETGEHRLLSEINSSEMEGYHSWSSGGGWMVFSSQRFDGYYSLPWFTFVDENGRASKPFVLPQENPDHYTFMVQAYNVPELLKSPIPIGMYDIMEAAESEALPSQFVMQED